ncbi:MAG TPA: hypothetical protein VMU87_08525 [Stellaceae bacterium]|nr:hypothetical protein [Stellaceae bacterium]
MNSRILRKLSLAAVAALILVTALPPARADDDHRGRGWREHEWHEHHERHFRRPPAVYYQPGYYAAPPVVYAPPPVVYAPPVVVMPPSLNITIPLR